METETKNWAEKEAEEYTSHFDGEKLPALKLIENEITEISIDTSKPFDKWVNQEDSTVKKIIPCMVAGNQYVWWLNVKNPLYSEIITKVALSYPEPLVIKILQTGAKQSTRYTIVK
jgi:hypothetical protein